jgi:YidC/Oxa1 family membrane protein insertase
MDLGRADSTHILVVLVFITTWLQTKLSTSAQSAVGQSAQQQQTTKMMLWLMPLMFSYITFNGPSGLAVYWVASNIIGMVMNWFVYGWRERPWKEIFIDPNSGNNAKRGPRTPRPSPAPALIEEGAEDRTTNKRSANGARNARTADGQSGSKRKDSGGGGRQSAQTTRTRPDPGRRRGR